MVAINEIQRRMVDDMRNEITSLPSNHSECAQLMVELLLAVDHEANEKEFMDKCVSKAVRTYFSLSGGTSRHVYLSRIKNKLTPTRYFSTLHRMAGARGEDAFKLVYRKLISNGVATSENGLTITMTDEAKKFI